MAKECSGTWENSVITPDGGTSRADGKIVIRTPNPQGSFEGNHHRGAHSRGLRGTCTESGGNHHIDFTRPPHADEPGVTEVCYWGRVGRLPDGSFEIVGGRYERKRKKDDLLGGGPPEDGDTGTWMATKGGGGGGEEEEVAADDNSAAAHEECLDRWDSALVPEGGGGPGIELDGAFELRAGAGSETAVEGKHRVNGSEVDITGECRNNGRQHTLTLDRAAHAHETGEDIEGISYRGVVINTGAGLTLLVGTYRRRRRPRQDGDTGAWVATKGGVIDLRASGGAAGEGAPDRENVKK